MVPGQANAQLWDIFGIDSASCAVYHELDVVLEDFQGTEKDISKDSMNKPEINHQGNWKLFGWCQWSMLSCTFPSSRANAHM